MQVLYQLSYTPGIQILAVGLEVTPNRAYA